MLQYSSILLSMCMYVLVEWLKKFCEILVSSMWAMYTHITLHAVYSIRVVCPLVTHHHWILLMYSAQSISIQTIPIMGNTYIFNIDTAASIGSQRWHSLLVMSVYVAHAQNNLYHFRMAVICATSSLLAVTTFLVSSNMPKADWIKGATISVVKGNNLLSRVHT